MRRSWVVALLSLGCVAACVTGTDYTPPPCPGCAPLLDAGSDAGVDAGVGGPFDAGPGVLTVAEWNLEFFGKADAGPSDDALQTANVSAVMGPLNADLWALEEVCDEDHFHQVIENLRVQYGEDYGYVLANDPSIGNAYPGFAGSWGQKTAVLYKKSVATLLGAQLVYQSGWGGDFVGRDPLELHLRLDPQGGAAQEAYFIVIHLKALADDASYALRQRESVDLKGYLDSDRASDAVFVVGDWNDQLDRSITCNGSVCNASPFANFVEDPGHYRFVTDGFGPSEPTTVHYASAIDHHLITDELMDRYVPGSAHVDRPDQPGHVPYIPEYGRTTSDHFPTVTRYRFP